MAAAGDHRQARDQSEGDAGAAGLAVVFGRSRTTRSVGGTVLLRDLFAGVDAAVPPGAAQVEVRALAVDSRRAAKGTLFAALPGVNADGAQFAAQAVQRGATAVLASRPLEVGVPVVVAKDPRPAFSPGGA